MKRILRILTPFAILIVMLALTAGCGKKLRSIFRSRRGFCAPIFRRKPLLTA